MNTMKTMALEVFRATLIAQGVPDHTHYAFKCPMCGTVQSAADLIAAGVGEDFDAVHPYLGFSCVGRFKGASSPRKTHDGKPCDWTLGGLLSLHTFEVISDDGKHHPHFEPASADEARKHYAARLPVAA